MENLFKAIIELREVARNSSQFSIDDRANIDYAYSEIFWLYIEKKRKYR